MSDIATKLEKLERANEEQRKKLVYEWVKAGHMSYSQFNVALHWITQQPTKVKGV